MLYKIEKIALFLLALCLIVNFAGTLTTDLGPSIALSEEDDTTSPTVSITSPADNTTTDQASIVITGTVSKDAWEEYTDFVVIVQRVSQPEGVMRSLYVDNDGSFTGSVSLSEGTNTFTIRATDEAGNMHSADITVRRVTLPTTTTPGGNPMLVSGILVVVALVMVFIAFARRGKIR